MILGVIFDVKKGTALREGLPLNEIKEG